MNLPNLQQFHNGKLRQTLYRMQRLYFGCLYSVEWNGGMERWNGTVEWNGGMEQWNGMVE